MPEEIEVPLEHLHEHIAEAHEEAAPRTRRNSGKERRKKEHADWTSLLPS